MRNNARNVNQHGDNMKFITNDSFKYDPEGSEYDDLRKLIANAYHHLAICLNDNVTGDDEHYDYLPAAHDALVHTVYAIAAGPDVKLWINEFYITDNYIYEQLLPLLKYLERNDRLRIVIIDENEKLPDFPDDIQIQESKIKLGEIDYDLS